MILCDFPQCRASENILGKHSKTVTLVNLFQFTSLLPIAEESRKFIGSNKLGWTLPVLNISARLISSPGCNWEQSLGYLRQNLTLCYAVSVTDFFCSSLSKELIVTNHIPVNSIPEHLSYNILAPCLQRKSWRIPPCGYKNIISDGLLFYSILFPTRNMNCYLHTTQTLAATT